MPLLGAPLPPDPEQLRLAVFDWLSAIPTPTQQPAPDKPGLDVTTRPLHRRKRRRSQSGSPTRPISPPLTTATIPPFEADMSAARTPSSSPKKRKTDNDRTPRAPAHTIDLAGSARMLPPSRSDSSASWTGQSDASPSVSRRSSPSKQMSALAGRPDGVETRLLRTDTPGLPPELDELATTLRAVYSGVGIISRDLEATITHEASHNRAFRSLYPFNFAPAEQRDAVGPTPSPRDVSAIYSWATHTHLMRAGEDNWNTQVHSPLLNLAIHGGAEHKTGQLLDVHACTSTPIIPTYLPSLTHTKRVDFVLVLNPWNDTCPLSLGSSTAEERVDRRRAALPDGSINHCFHESLCRRPIAVSIETKRDGGGDREAQLQTGTWLAAQWNLLGDLVAAAPAEPPTPATTNEGDDGNGRRGTAAAAAGAGESPSSSAPAPEMQEDRVFLADSAPDHHHQAPPSGDRLKDLPFLPAIVVHGHDWSFAAATREGPKTILWTDCPFGSTRDVIDIYKIVAGIQYIARYAERTFWPWYKDAVLGMGR